MEYIPAKTILSGYREGSSWFGVNYNMNIYKGCCHGCIYCDSRSDCYGVEEFDRVRAKKDALAIIERDICSKRKKGVVGTGAMSDPYNPLEKELELTRGALMLVDKYGHGSSICTKSSLVERDVDILCSIRQHSPVIVKMTVTAAEDCMSKKIEPFAPETSRRFNAMERMAGKGIYTGVMLMPVLPFILDNDENIAGIVKRAAESGARFVYPAFGVTLRQNQREWYFEKLDTIFPGMKERYIRQFGNAYSCVSPNAKNCWRLFARECENRKLLFRMQDIIAAYQNDYLQKQISFF